MPTYKNGNGQFSKKPVDESRIKEEATGKQQSDGKFHINEHHEMMSLGVGSGLYANGGSLVNPMGFPGYGHLYFGTYMTYRWMLKHPVLRLVRSIATSPIMANRWEYVPAEGGTEQMVKFVRDNLDPIRSDLLENFFARGRDYGWASAEPIWEVWNGKTRLQRMKPLSHESTECLRDDYGNFVGLRNNVSIKDKPYTELAAPYKAWKYTYDSEVSYVYGRSWLENVRATAWKDWLDCAQQLQRLGAKISGMVCVITAPAGSFPGPADANGNPTQVTYRENAKEVIKALANGAPGVYFPSIALNVDSQGSLDAMKLLGELATKSLTNIDIKDFGSNSPAITGLLERMKHNEELMFAGGLRPSRTGLEAQHGAKADADTHTDTGLLNAEMDDKDFAGQLQPIIDAMLVLNWGEYARGLVRIVPPRIADPKMILTKALILAMTNDPDFAAEFCETVDMDDLIRFLGFKMKKSFDAAKITKAREEARKKPDPAQPGNVDPEGGRPKKEDQRPKKPAKQRPRK